jgi:hypothetical protein
MKEKLKSEDEARTLWTVVDSAFEVIFLKKNVILRYQTLFDVFHLLVISDYGRLVQEWLEESFSKIADLICSKLEGFQGEKVAIFNKEYAEYLNLVDKAQKIAIYYDSRYAIPKRSPLTILIGHNVIQTKVRNSKALDDIIQEILHSMDHKRQGMYHDYLQLRNAVNNIVIRANLDRPWPEKGYIRRG